MSAAALLAALITCEGGELQRVERFESVSTAARFALVAADDNPAGDPWRVVIDGQPLGVAVAARCDYYRDVEFNRHKQAVLSVEPCSDCTGPTITIETALFAGGFEKRGLNR